MDVDDIVVDNYDGILWRLRALYGLKNAKGTKMLAIGGLAAYSEPGQRPGPAHAKEVWDYDFEIVSEAQFRLCQLHGQVGYRDARYPALSGIEPGKRRRIYRLLPPI